MKKAEINITNLQRREKIDQRLVRSTLKKAIDNLFCGSYAIDVIFCSPLYIRKLNKKYRNKDNKTDILSFEFKEYENDVFFIGELAVCPSEARKNSLIYTDFWSEDGWAAGDKTQDFAIQEIQGTSGDFEKEIMLLLIHGVLHLFGYDHDEEMKRMQYFLYNGVKGGRKKNSSGKRAV